MQEHAESIADQARSAVPESWRNHKTKPIAAEPYRRPDGSTVYIKTRKRSYTLAAKFRGLLGALISGKRIIKGVTPYGCTPEDLIWHIERQFVTDENGITMSWHKRGFWNIDHIMPISAFDTDDIQDMLEANHWSNLRPVWAEDNTAKAATIPDIDRASYAIRQGWSPRDTIIDENRNPIPKG